MFSGNDELQSKIDWAKVYYNQNLEKQNNLSIKLLNGKSTMAAPDIKRNKKTPIWEKSTSGISDLYTFVETPIKYEHKITPTFHISNNPNTKPVANQQIIDASFDRLIIYKDKSGKIDERIISFVPDEDYLKRHKGDISHNKIDKLDEDFFGYLHYKDWEGNALFILRIEKGIPTNKYEGFTKNPIFNPNTTSGEANTKVAFEENCLYSMTWDWYQDCYYPSPESTSPTYCDPVVIYNVEYTLISCSQPPINGGGDNPPPIPPCLGVLNLATGECVVTPVTPCDFVREAAKNIKFKQRVDLLVANTSGNTEKVYAVNYTTNIPFYAQGAINDPYVSASIGAPIDFYGHNHFGTGEPIFSAEDMNVLYKLDSANLINDHKAFTFFVSTGYGQYVISIENKTQFQSYIANFATPTTFNAWVIDYQITVNYYFNTFGKSINEAKEIAFLSKIAGQGIKLFKKDSNGIFKPIKKSATSSNVISDPCDNIEE